jgi:hypothetical protein
MAMQTDCWPTCGSEINEYALNVMMRNRAARDAHFREITAQLERTEVDDDQWWTRLKYGSIGLLFIVLMSWVVWASANITQLKLGAK